MDTNKDLLDIQREVHNQLKESVEKFCYYLIALCVSSLAFVVYQTKDDIINYPKILLALAVIFWATSIFYGLKFIKIQQHGLFLSYHSYDNLRNKFLISKDNLAKIKIVDETFKDEIKVASNKSKAYAKIQSYTFFIAVIIYIIWHGWEMYNKTIFPSC